jgi:hypothetical protein
VSWDKIKSWGAAVVAIFGVLTVSLWGVPYYIGTQVREQVTHELKEQAVSDELDGVKTIAQTNSATLAAIAGQLERMEKAQIRRDELFADYLERQAERGR